MSQLFSGVGSFLGSVAVVFLFAWVARAFLDARELTWRRLALAALAGIALGDSVAVFLVLDNLSELQNLQVEEIAGIALPFQLVATMGAIVVLEVLFSRRRERSRRVGFPRPFRWLRNAAGNVSRAVEVSRILARQGLAPLLGWRGGEVPSRDPVELARRARMAMEEAGGMFVKLGQLLATRPDLVPPEAQAELSRLHSSAAPLDRPTVERAMADQLGRPIAEVFAEIDWTPLGSASIAQAHQGRLLDGSRVVVKVRRPDLSTVVDRDLAIMRWLARSAARRTEWGRTVGIEALAAEFAETLRGELDFNIESRNLVEMAEAVAEEPMVRVPRVYPELTSDGLLVMEWLDGTPMSKWEPGADVDRRALADALCRSQVGAMLEGDRFHGDPHPGNILALDDGRLGLIDLGISDRLDAFERAAVFQMLVALRLEQPTLLYESMVSIGAVDPARHDPDEIERAFAQFMSAYLGSGLPPPEAMTDLMQLTGELGLTLPSSTVAMFRALATLTGTLEHLSPGYPIVETVADIGGDELRRRLAPSSAVDYLREEWAQIGPLLERMPRHVDRLATMLEHGRLVTRVRHFSDADDRRFIERVVNRVILTFLSIGTGVVSVMLMGTDAPTPMLLGETGLLDVLGWLGLFISVVLLLRVLLAVLRSEHEDRTSRHPG